MQIAVISSHPMCLPVVEFLANTGRLAGLAVEGSQTPVAQQLQMVAAQLGKPFAVLNRDGLTDHLKAWIGQCDAEVVFVMGFSLVIPKPLLELPKLGFLNFHGGPLPEYRGPQPVFWQLRHGKSELALTVHQMVSKMDAGDVAHRASLPLSPEDTYGAANYKLASLALQAARSLVVEMEGEGIQFTEQDESKAAYQDRPGPRDIVIDWARQDAEEIARLARATNPTYVGAVFSLGGGPAYVPQATPLEGILGDEPSGTVVRASLEHGLWVRCARGTTLRLDILSTDLGVMTGGRALAVLGLREGAVLQVQPT